MSVSGTRGLRCEPGARRDGGALERFLRDHAIPHEALSWTDEMTPT